MKSLIILILACGLFFACNKNKLKCGIIDPSYHWLDSTSLKRNPYLVNGKNLDSLVYISDKADTLVVVHIDRRWNIWVESDFTFSSPDCGGNYALTKSEQRTTSYDRLIPIPSWDDGGEGYISISHGKRGFYGWNQDVNADFINSICVQFKTQQYIFKDSDINNPLAPNYQAVLYTSHRQFKDVVWSYAYLNSSQTCKAYMNKEFGLVQVIDNKNNLTYTLAYP